MQKVLVAGEVVAVMALCLGLLYWHSRRPHEESFDEWFASQDPRRHQDDEGTACR
ncbi:MAG TPA: hypothetical protein VFL64_01805 [Rhizobacter sp.]|nr:hypothetical protein [Rhizobacter sp.]